MERAALYIRVSTEEQAKYGLSLDEQRHALIEHANRKGYNIVGLYADEGASASKKPQRRHEFQRMLNDCRRGNVDVIVFLKLDRWYRSVRDYYATQSILEECNVRWECVLEKYDITTAPGRLNLNIKLSIDENESAQTGDRTKFVLDGNVRQGKVNTGMQPWGYMVSEEKKPVKDPKTEHMVSDMFKHYFSCLSAYETHMFLADRYGITESYTTTARRLKNPAYTGEYRGNPNYRPAYITQEQHSFILKQFAQRTRTPQNRRVYMFNGLLRCPHCGNILVSCTMNKRHQGYRCKKHDNRACDYKPTVREDYIEMILLNDLPKFNFAMTINKKRQSDVDPTIYEQRLKRLNDIYVMGNISDEDYQVKSWELKAKIAEIKAPKPREDSSTKELRKMLSDGKFSAIYATLTPQERRTLWHSIVENIVVNENGRIEEINYIL